MDTAICVQVLDPSFIINEYFIELKNLQHLFVQPVAQLDHQA